LEEKKIPHSGIFCLHFNKIDARPRAKGKVLLRQIHTRARAEKTSQTYINSTWGLGAELSAVIKDTDKPLALAL